MSDQVYSMEPIIIDQGELELQIHVEVSIVWVNKEQRTVAIRKIHDKVMAEIEKVFGQSK